MTIITLSARFCFWLWFFYILPKSHLDLDFSFKIQTSTLFSVLLFILNGPAPISPSSFQTIIFPPCFHFSGFSWRNSSVTNFNVVSIFMIFTLFSIVSNTKFNATHQDRFQILGGTKMSGRGLFVKKSHYIYG